jgi:competence protein ComEC
MGPAYARQINSLHYPYFGEKVNSLRPGLNYSLTSVAGCYNLAVRLLKHRFRHTTVLGIFLLALLSGIGFGHIFGKPSVWLIALAGLVWAVSRLLGRTLLSLLLIALFAAGCGLWRGAQYARQLSIYDELYHAQTTLTVQALGDAVYGKGHQLTFDAHNIQLEDGSRIVGKIAVSGFGTNAVFIGDTLEVTGKLYPSSGSYQGRMSYARLTLLQHHQTLVDAFRRRFAAGIGSSLPEPAAPFALGLLIGQRATLPDSVKQDLLMVGLTHIIAVSGYNLTIMLRASKNLFARRSKRLSTAFSLFLIGVFLLITGNSASIVRAAIVSMLSIMAGYYGRALKPLNLILIAAVITAWAQPTYVWGDISWYLSFLAFYGVLVVSPLIAGRVPKWLGEWIIFQVALESISAEIMTLPIVLYTFGQMSFVALPANLIIAVLVPVAMLLSLVAGLAGMVAPLIAGWLAWPATLVLTCMLDSAHLMAGLPHIFAEEIGLSAFQMLLLYALVGFLTLVIWFNRPKSATVTDINQLLV